MRTTKLLPALLLAAAAAIAVPTQASSADRPSPTEALAAHPGAARAAEGQAFRTGQQLVDPDGSTHARMQRTYRGLPVVGGDLVVHQGPKGGWKGVSQTLAAPLNLSTTPRVSAETAASRAGGERMGDPTLVVDTLGARPALAWKVMTTGVQHDGTPSRLATYVDAKSGAVLRSEQEIQTVDGQGQSLYSGTVPLQLTLASGTYSMKDPLRGNATTLDVNNGTDLALFCPLLGIGCATGPVFSGPDNQFGSGTNANRESAGVDAHYGAATTWDYFKNTHGRNGIFNTGAGAPSRVHYGSNYVNAFWDGKKMTYGDGDGVNFGPLVSLDVAGHEMAHGVTQNSANLTYSGESGGLNEATSDIFGSLVEFYANNSNDLGDYYIGEEFDLAQGDGFRRMDKPSTDGKSVDCWYSGVGNLDVHYSSGVGNHFFYLLAEGSGAQQIGGRPHNSPTCNGSTVTGVGRDVAGKIFYRALTVYMTSGTTYAQARTATLNAAKDLYPANPSVQAAVAAAWSAVSVN